MAIWTARISRRKEGERPEGLTINRWWLALIVSLPLLWWFIPYFLRVRTLNGQSIVYRPDGGFDWNLLAFLALKDITLILIIPIVAELGQRFPIWHQGRLRWRHLGFHLLFAAIYGLLRPPLDWTIQILVGHRELSDTLVWWLRYPSSRMWQAPTSYFFMLVATQAWFFYWYTRDRERQLTAARLSALKAQIHPHFLFNTLHSVSALMEDDVPAARRMIAGLTDLLRSSIAEPAGELVPLNEEIEVARTYLAIEEMRFADRVKITFDIEDAALGAGVPHLILQPLVENAVRHGVSTLSSGAELGLRVRRDRERLEILVEDNGPGPSLAAEATSKAPVIHPASGLAREASGLGLRNVRERIRAFYGSAARLELEERPGGGCLCRLSLPFKRLGTSRR